MTKTKDHIDPEFFEMPVHRLLTEEEVALLENNGIRSKWVSCKNCREAGGTADEREFCSLECYCEFHQLDINAIELLKRKLIGQAAAKEGDKVRYRRKIYKVVSTDFSMDRLKKKFRVTYSYILIGKQGELRVKDLEYPLRKLGYGIELPENEFNDEEE